MHIPDGYLSPEVYIPAYICVIPLFKSALKKLKNQLNEETFPLISSLTALSFIMMMFNMPVPGGTSGHIIGAAVIAILFGPWTGFMSISLVLLIQGVIFGDGGITSYPLNVLAMGFTASFVSYYLYYFLSKRINKITALFISGWTGIVSASAVVAFVLGIQPMIASDGLGHPLFFPFGLSVTVPALVGTHMLFFGIVEGLYTVIAIRTIERNFGIKESAFYNYFRRPDYKKQIVVFRIIIAGIFLFVPLGLLTKAPAWGEWSFEHFRTLIGFIPQSMQKFSDVYKAPIANYGLLNLNLSLGYYVSAAVGIISLLFILYLIFKLLKLKKNRADIVSFAFYLLIIVLLTIQSNIYSIGIAFLVLSLLSGSSFIKIVRRTLITLFVFNFVISVSFTALSLYKGVNPLYPLLLINLRTMTLTFATFLIIEKVNLFNIFAFSSSLSFLITLSYVQIASYKKTLNDFYLAFKSRSLKKPGRNNLIQFISLLTVFFLNSALNNSREIYLAMKSRGFGL